MFRLTLTKTINTSSSTLQQAVCLFLFMKSLSNISSDNHLNIYYTKQIGIDLKVTGKWKGLLYCIKDAQNDIHSELCFL